MSRVVRIPVRYVAPVIAALALAVPCAAQTEVKIVGVPDVSVPEPIPHSELVVFRDIAVSSGGDMTLAGMVPAAGYTSVMISLAVEPQSSDGGSVTAYLVPTEKFVSDACDKGAVLFPLTAGVSFDGDEKIVGSMSFHHQLAFPRYAAYLTNESDRPVKAQLFVYLRN